MFNYDKHMSGWQWVAIDACECVCNQPIVFHGVEMCVAYEAHTHTHSCRRSRRGTAECRNDSNTLGMLCVHS